MRTRRKALPRRNYEDVSPGKSHGDSTSQYRGRGVGSYRPVVSSGRYASTRPSVIVHVEGYAMDQMGAGGPYPLY